MLKNITTDNRIYGLAKWGLVFLLSLFSLGFAADALAQAPAGMQGLSITPFLLERQMQKGETSEEIIDIINTSGNVMPVNITVNDFFPQGEDGQPVFVDPGQGDPHFSLSKWITIESSPKQVLQPNEKTSIRFSITPPLDAEDGGHYGALLFSSGPVQPAGTAVAVTQKLGAIVLVKLGKAVPAGQVGYFKADHSFYEYPTVNFITRFKNTGNVHVKPRGGIVIYNWFGKKVGTAVVNENANNVLPDSERQFKSAWKGGLGFGYYKAEVQLVYDDNGTLATASAGFWVIPWKLSLAVACSLFVLILLATWGLKKYNRWIVAKAYQSVKKD